jgi:hypothetical protein
MRAAAGGLAVVTGASSGLGRAYAGVLAADGYDVLLIARREDRLNELAVEIGRRFDVAARALVLDLASTGAAAAVAATVVESGRAAAVLVNNAGYYLDGDFLDYDWDDQAAMLRVLLTTPTELTHALLPGMLAAGRGAVVTMASLGAFLPSTPHQTLYGPVKHYLVAFNRSLANEYAGRGVTFTAVCPGFTATEMMDRGSAANARLRLPKGMISDPERVARQSWAAARRGRTVVVPGVINKAAAGLLRVLPGDVADRLATSVFGWLTRPA